MSLWQLKPVLSSFLQHADLPFAEALPEEAITQACHLAGVPTQPSQPQDDKIVYTPAVTLWAFLSQVLFKGENRSCLAATARVVVLMIALGRDCSDNTGAYCRARGRLPLVVMQILTLQTADNCEALVPQDWLWKGRHVHLVDGTTASMPDTPENQAEFPQPPTQKAGLGFPIIRMVVALSLATAMVGAMTLGRYEGKETGETALLRRLLDRFKPGDILLADRYLCSYFMIALLQELRLDFVVRLHQARHSDLRRGRRLGPGDYLVTWHRPARPEWMDQATYERMPESIQVRQVQVQVQEPGSRVETLAVVTTLLDADTYTKDDVAELYQQRWLVELDIRALKVSLGMDVLRCKTPEMVRKEIWTCMLAYNLIRKSMLAAALATKPKKKCSPRELSFTTALQKIAASWSTLAVCNAEEALVLITVHLQQLATHRVGHRPDRVEPRANKRRPKILKLLTKPRQQARAELLVGAAQ
jgi:putative transposase